MFSDGMIDDELNEFKAQYYIGDAAARYLLQKHKQFSDKAEEIRVLFAKSCVRAEHCPSSICLENAVACFWDVVEGVAGKIINGCAVLEKFYPLLVFPSPDVIAGELSNEGVLEKFLKDYAEAFAFCKSCDSDDFGVSETSVAEAPDDDVLYCERETSTAYEVPDSAVVIRGDSIESAFNEYLDVREDKISGLMSGFPNRLRKDVWDDIYCVFQNRTSDFASGFYVNGMEHRFLDALEQKGTVYYDDLFVRLKKEQKLGDVALQRIFLARFVTQHRIKCVDSMSDAVRDEWFFYNSGEKKVVDRKLMRAKLNFLQQCFKQHREWLKKYLSH